MSDTLKKNAPKKLSITTAAAVSKLTVKPVMLPWLLPDLVQALTTGIQFEDKADMRIEVEALAVAEAVSEEVEIEVSMTDAIEVSAVAVALTAETI